MHTTLNAIREHCPCADGWVKLLRHLNKTAPDDEPLALTTILESNGLDDAIGALCSLKDHDREIRLFAVACARQVQHLMKDPRSIAALDVAERYANGQCTEEELSAALLAAIDAYAATYYAGYADTSIIYGCAAATHAAALSADTSADYAHAAYAAAYAAVHAAKTSNGAREIQAKQTALFREFFS